MNWHPSASDIEWTQNTISSVKEGGVWGVPCCDSVLQIFHSKKEVVIVHGNSKDITLRRIITVLSKMGWKTKRKK